MKTKKKFYIIEKYFGRYGDVDITKGTVKAHKIEDIVLPEKFLYSDEEKLPISKYNQFIDTGDFTKVSARKGYLEEEEAVIGIGSTKAEAIAMMVKAEAQTDNDELEGNWD